MSFIRTDGQAALNSLLVAARETFDHYRDAAELVEANLGQIMRSIGGQRREFIHRLEDAVRASGDLPTMPDPDKEAGEMLIHHIVALIKSHYAADIIEQRIEGEKNLAALIIEAQATELDQASNKLLDEFALHVSEIFTQLQRLQTQLIVHEE